MSQLDLSGCKKRKRGERVFKFKVFGERGYPAEFNGSTFQENVRALLYGEWCVWGDGELVVSAGDMRWNNSFDNEDMCRVLEAIGVPGTFPIQSSNVIELQGEGHSLHGVFHSNGFGHLLCINGSESGSDLPGYQIMEFWDRLCSGLGARKVSLKDVARKKGMDLRLLHAVAYGKPWFGHWDYTFGRGSYGVSQEMYLNAVKAIQNIPLSLIAHQLGFQSFQQNDIQILLPRYQLLSGHSLITVGDLFHFMLELKFRIPKECSSIGSNYPGIMSDASCRWSPKRVEMAIHVVVEALKCAEYRWVSRQHVRDVARAYIGDTGLLDFVLKSLGNHMVGKYFVRRCLNPVTKVLEYCLEDVSRPFPKQEAAFPISEPRLKPQQISRAQLVKDTFCVYKNILGNHNLITNTRVLGTIPMAARAILDSKHLIKEYYSGETSKNYETNKQTIYCTVILANSGTSAGPDEVSTPYHRFVLRNNAAFDELKCEVEKTFREIYFGLRNFVAESVRNMKFKGSDLVFKTVKPGSKIVFEGKQEGPYGVICEGLMAVDCVCGAKDDDESENCASS
ncbi:UNVERIFIED_CONTAM: PHD finger protein PERSISTENT TAPETAL CELL 1 [Sesamum radiatum]|uniref:PHD finger protein PERSISTENT TAPETAL CELL 1 n=1 Tax=Sesamum radiatum TaxID=300843 RepID=A0AAW2JQ50_SESRA